MIFIRVKECMCSNVITAKQDDNIACVAKLMKENDIGCMPVCDNSNKVIGFITDRDIVLRGIAEDKDCNQTKVKDLMVKNIIKTTPDTDIEDASKTMQENQIRRIPVIENERIVGILSIGDIARSEKISCKDTGHIFECICIVGNDCKQEYKQNG